MKWYLFVITTRVLRWLD